MANAYRSVLKDAVNPTGNALPADVLVGKTFSNADGIDKTGTMVNNGAVTITLTAQDPSYTVPEGYHNGSGTVSFTPSGGDGADLVVTCSDAFAGTTISCTDGTTTFTEICPSTSPYEVTFESIPTGTWTISGFANGQTFSTTVTILDFTAELHFIPEGSTVTPTDDIQTWLNCANIWDKTYSTISQVLSDTATLLALISNSNAVDYMVRSTTWASDVCADSTAMTYIGTNDYCADSLLSDPTWLNLINNSSYFENVLNIKVPTMTSNTSPSGEASASNAVSGYEAYKAFDGSAAPSASSGWASGSSSFPQWVQYMFTTLVNVRRMSIIFNRINTQSTITISASNDGISFVDLEEGISVTGSNEEIVGFADNTENYMYYRVSITSQTRTQGSIGQIDSLQFNGRL